MDVANVIIIRKKKIYIKKKVRFVVPTEVPRVPTRLCRNCLFRWTCWAAWKTFQGLCTHAHTRARTHTHRVVKANVFLVL